MISCLNIAAHASLKPHAGSVKTDEGSEKRLEFVMQGGIGNQMMDLRNAVDLARVLDRALTEPLMLEAGDVDGLVCPGQSAQEVKASRDKYVSFQETRPRLSSILKLSPSVHWSHHRPPMTPPSKCCEAYIDGHEDSLTLQYRDGFCDARHCTIVTSGCFTWHVDSPLIASLRNVESAVLSFGSLFNVSPLPPSLTTDWMAWVDGEPSMQWGEDCELGTHREELDSGVSQRLSQVPGLGAIYDAVHLRMGDGYRTKHPAPCGPECYTFWPSAAAVLLELNGRDAGRPVWIASDNMHEALKLARRLLTTRPVVSLYHANEATTPQSDRKASSGSLPSGQVARQKHQHDLWGGLLDYLEPPERHKAALAIPGLVDILVCKKATGLYSNAGFYSTFTRLLHRVRVCDALEHRRALPNASQLVAATRGLVAERYAGHHAELSGWLAR